MKQRGIYAAIVALALILGLILAMVVAEPERANSIRARLGMPSPDPDPYAVDLHNAYRGLDATLEPGRIIIIGDSHIQRMDMALIDGPAVNFGIGGDTAPNIARRIQEYQSVSTARTVIIEGGVNDLFRDRSPEAISTAMQSALDAAGNTNPVIIMTVPPVSEDRFGPALNETIRTVNARYKELCTAPCRIADISAALAGPDGALDPAYDIGDGVHLNSAGYAVVADTLNATLNGASE